MDGWEIPDALWDDLRAAGLLGADLPTPGGRAASADGGERDAGR
jgi:hypothetical protein